MIFFALISKREKALWALALFSLLVGVGSLTYTMVRFGEAQEVFLDTARMVLRHDSMMRGEIHLTEGAGWQRVNVSFMVAQVSAKEHLSGIRVTGLIVNASSVNYKSATFEVTVAGQTGDFTIGYIVPGMSQPFAVDIPDVPASEAWTAYFGFIRGEIAFG